MNNPVIETEHPDNSADFAAQLRARDPEALAGLHREYGQMLYNIIFRIVKDHDIAEDLAQEALVRAWNRSWQLDAERGSLGPWLTGIAKHCALDYEKSAKKKRCVHVEIGAIPATMAPLDEGVASSERTRRVTQALEQLPPHQRLVLELAYFEELSQAVIAEKLSKPLGTVKGWTRAALLRLRVNLGEGFSREY